MRTAINIRGTRRLHGPVCGIFEIRERAERRQLRRAINKEVRRFLRACRKTTIAAIAADNEWREMPLDDRGLPPQMPPVECGVTANVNDEPFAVKMTYGRQGDG